MATWGALRELDRQILEDNAGMCAMRFAKLVKAAPHEPNAEAEPQDEQPMPTTERAILCFDILRRALWRMPSSISLAECA